MADHRFLEFHDSKLLAVSVTPERAIVDLDAVIQTWDGTGSERRGTNWMQHVRLEILNPRVNNSITDLAAWIWDGRVVSRGLVDDDGDETLTVPLALDADVRLELENVRGERLEIFGTSLVVTVVAEARFLQNVPSDWDPDRASSE